MHSVFPDECDSSTCVILDENVFLSIQFLSIVHAVTFNALKALIMKFALLLDVTYSNLVEKFADLWEEYVVSIYSENGGEKFFRNAR
jgi:hypothetical protein